MGDNLERSPGGLHIGGQSSRRTEVIGMMMADQQPLHVTRLITKRTKPFAQNVITFVKRKPTVDQRQRIMSIDVDIDRPDREWGWQRDNMQPRDNRRRRDW